MLSDDHAVAEIVFGAHGIASSLEKGCVHISSSTISAAFARRLDTQHGGKEQEFLSAPVFGRPEAAESKKLVVVAAGDAQAIEWCRPLFDAVGRYTFIVGSEPWHANVVKLGGNFMIASMWRRSEKGFCNHAQSRIDHHLFLDVINELFGSPSTRTTGALWQTKSLIRRHHLKAWTQGYSIGP